MVGQDYANMFTAYFDASGDIHSAEALALAGFVGSADSWTDWEKEWLGRLNTDNLTQFHRNELNGWPEVKLKKLLDDLAGIIAAHGFYRFGTVIINEDLRKMTSAKSRREWHVNSYSYAGRCAAREMKEWAASWSGPLPELMFEDGDTGRGELTNLLREDGYPRPDFRPKRDRVNRKTGITDKAVVAFQAGDLYAYDLFSRARAVAKGETVSRNFASGINPIIERLEGRSGVATPGHIQFMADGLDQRDELIMRPSVKINTRDFIR